MLCCGGQDVLLTIPTAIAVSGYFACKKQNPVVIAKAVFTGTAALNVLNTSSPTNQDPKVRAAALTRRQVTPVGASTMLHWALHGTRAGNEQS